MSSREALAEAIRSAVKVGHIGPNATALVERGGTFALTHNESMDAAERMASWLVVHDAETKGDALEEAERLAAEAYDAGVDARLSSYDKHTKVADAIRNRANEYRRAAKD